MITIMFVYMLGSSEPVTKAVFESKEDCMATGKITQEILNKEYDLKVTFVCA